jgi:predicted TIM-barrel fold metal-dependent hydrolase
MLPVTMSETAPDPGLFDANVLLGPLACRPLDAPEDVSVLEAVLAAYGIDQALVTHTYAKWHQPVIGNARLVQEIFAHPRLCACWIVLPAGTDEVPSGEQQVAELLASGARAARLCPAAHRLSLEPWELDSLLGPLAERRVPLFLDMDNTHWSEARPWHFVEWACRTFPTLPLVLLREPQSNLRTLFPLLDRCPNLIVETSYFQAHDGIALVVERWGAHRMVFGTGLPIWDPGLPLAGIRFAGLSAADYAAVAGGTLRALLARCVA